MDGGGRHQTFGVECSAGRCSTCRQDHGLYQRRTVNEGLQFFIKNFSLSMVGTVSRLDHLHGIEPAADHPLHRSTIMGTFCMVADRKRIFAFFERWIPQRASGK